MERARSPQQSSDHSTRRPFFFRTPDVGQTSVFFSDYSSGCIQRQAESSPLPEKTEEEQTLQQKLFETTVQCMCTECEKEQQEKPALQPKLSVGEAGDLYEQEADRVANQVALHVQASKTPSIQTRLDSAPPRITPLVMRQGEGPVAASSRVEQGIQHSRGSGEAITQPVRGTMEQALGGDFGGVRIHANSEADALNRSLNARAFTTGKDIYFKSGEYQPESPEGQKLLAHELTHVVQQGAALQGIQRQVPSTPAPAPRPPFSITQIPGIMTALSWLPAAALMLDWFSRSPNSAPASGLPNVSAITVSWANGFSRAKSVYDSMIADKVWVNSAARALIQSRLVAAGLPSPGATLSFGTVSGAAPTLHNTHVNHRSVSQGLTAPLDGLAGALANFDFYVMVEGAVTDIGPSPRWSVFTSRSYRVDIARLAIYIRDSYDFNGDQPLGCWNPVANTVSRTGLGRPNETCVNNGTFRTWRTANSRGGDFYAYSDLDVRSTSDSFTFNV